jgi:serine phosphatase RsbU (regulator of sigma subunit)
VADQDDRALDALRLLLRASHLMPLDDLPILVAEAARRLGANHGMLYLVDYDQVVLVPMTETRGASAAGSADEPIAIEGTLAGRVYSDVVQHTAAVDASTVLWTPVLDGTERIGVLRLDFPAASRVEGGARESCLDVAALLAEMIVSRSRYGDTIEHTRRRAQMTIPAELQWQLLPPLTYVSPRVAVAGILAPTAAVAGDCFDYALNGDTAHVAIFDAMGHGLEATLLAAVAVSALRNARREQLDLPATVQRIDAAIAAQFPRGRFVTGVIGQLDILTGQWRWTSCGHPAALLVRDGRVVKTLDGHVTLPLGLGHLAEPREVGEERLEPGDRLLLYTDGVTEARDTDGGFFGTDRLVDFLTKEMAAGRPVAETLRRLNLAILGHQHGTLQDDATTVIVEWLSDEPHRFAGAV